jgi:hypothetical protein
MRLNYASRTNLLSATTRFGARIPGAPVGYLAVDRTGMRVAALALPNVRAGFATKRRQRHNWTSFGMQTIAAQLCAGTPFTKWANHAIFRAEASIARADFGKSTAWFAVER